MFAPVQESEPAAPAGANHAGGSYLALLRTPGAARFSVTGIIGRTPMAMFGLGTVLLITSSTGSYGRAGLVSGAASISYAATAPQVARLADRFGQHRVLRPLACVFAVACGLFVACAGFEGAPFWAVLLAGCLAGSSMPSLGSMVRARWSALLTDPASLQAAFALESVADEMVFVICPAIVTLLATTIPPAGVLLCMVIGVTGTLLFAAQRRTEPAVRRPDPAGGRARGARLPAPGLVTIAPVYLCIGAMFATIDLSTIDCAAARSRC